jgi:hypothetical protein
VSQDVELVGPVVVTANSTAFSLRRRLVSCDRDQDLVIDPLFAQTFVFAYSQAWGYHGTSRGSVSLTLNATLVKPKQEAIDRDADLKAADFFMPNFTVPANESTHYACVNFEAPNPNTSCAPPPSPPTASDSAPIVPWVAARGALTPPSWCEHTNQMLADCAQPAAAAVGPAAGAGAVCVPARRLPWPLATAVVPACNTALVLAALSAPAPARQYHSRTNSKANLPTPMFWHKVLHQ